MHAWKLGRTRVRIGVNGCVCVLLGALGCSRHGEYRNKAKGRKIWSHRPWLGLYGRGNFPEHHVLQNNRKMGANGTGWVRRGSHGYNRAYVHGGARKQGETRQKTAIRTYFQVWSRARKHHVVDKDGQGGQRGYRGGNMAEQRVCGAIWLVKSKSKAKKQTTSHKKTKTSTRKLM